ncbi:NADPH-dependent curcumin reductase CurA [Pararhizobium capsulatum DSM 1112]|uniref:NADPH-dependent curcumin reductase CurA n=1 Tax=Pararhizobium capsulatum DSM 1112 TaxID=1121113 RepID=A0ABU0C0J0_9HYPH|nr:NADPH-dependent curcumin reductase CurA [Pararhizobium capsulatum DSM 1112]
MTSELPELRDGQELLRVLFLSLDPYMRGRMSATKSYAEPVPVGGVMECEAVCEVVQSRSQSFQPGEIVRPMTGWCTYAVMDAPKIRHVDTHRARVSTALGVLGMPSFTAYGGMRFIGQPKPGETVVVAAASGPVGSLVRQLARIADARDVGVAGGKDKCDYIRDELGYDAVVDHRSPTFDSELATACPKGIDVYFENVGGHVWDAVFPLLDLYARVPVCGLIAQYNGPRCRRLAKDWEKPIASAEAWMLIAHIRILSRRLASYYVY